MTSYRCTVRSKSFLGCLVLLLPHRLIFLGLSNEYIVYTSVILEVIFHGLRFLCNMLYHFSVSRLLQAATLIIPICSAFPAEPRPLQIRVTGSLTSFIASESPIALQGVLNNIGSTGSLAPDADPGMVVASPSTVNPNCMLNLSAQLDEHCNAFESETV